MLFGTNLLFRIAYFLTSFSPALFLLSLNFKCNLNLNIKNAFLNNVANYLIHQISSIIVVLIAVVAAIYIKRYLLKRQCNKLYEIKSRALNFNDCRKKFKSTNGYVLHVQDGIKINSGFIAFAISVIAPSAVLTLINNDQTLSSLLVILMFFFLLMMSNDVFPNIILPLFGVHLMVTKDNYNIFYLSQQSDFLSGIKKLNSLGNAGSLARTYVLSKENFNDADMEDV